MIFLPFNLETNIEDVTFIFMFSHSGAIELSILSKHYQTEIAVVDIETGRVDRFGKIHST